MDRKIVGVGLSGGSAVILMWQLGYHFPEMMATAPVGLEAAFTAVISTVVGWAVPNKKAAQ